MTRQQIIIAIAVVAGQLLQPYVYKYLIAPPGRFIERIVRTRGWRACFWFKLASSPRW